MASFFDSLSSAQEKFIQKQHMFFVATAPLEAEGRINISPKGLDSFKTLSGKEVAYMDFVGSGNETSAHTLQNSRITLMFCAFEGAPNILRIYGKGKAILPGSDEWNSYAQHFDLRPNTRQIISIAIQSVQTSCGYAVPLYEFQAHRDILDKWADNKGPEDLQTYIEEKNVKSIDGLSTDWAEKLALQ